MSKQFSHFNATHNAKEKIHSVLTELSEILSKSYSPFGSSSIMINRNRVSKDGYEILNSLNPEGEFAQYITNMVRSVTDQTLFTAGDGKTTAVLLAEKLFNNLNNVYELEYKDVKTPQEFLMDVNGVAGAVINKMNEIKHIPDCKEDYLNVAHTSLNNDSQLLEYISEALDYFDIENGETPKILTSTDEDYNKVKVECVDGMKVPSAIDYGLLTETSLFNNIKVMVIGERIENQKHIEKLREIADFCSNEGVSMLIMYPDMNGYAKRMVRNKLQELHMADKPVNTLFLQMSRGGTKEQENFYDDLMAYLGTVTLNISQDDFMEHFKNLYENFTVADISAEKFATTFLVKERATDDVYNETINHLESIIKETEGTEKEKAENRLNRITQKTVTIRVGANTPEDRNRVFNMFQDATLAIKHSTEGIVSGMNSAVPKTINTIDNFKPEFESIVFAIKESYMELLNLIIEKSRRTVEEEVIDEILDYQSGKDIVKGYDIKEEEITERIVNTFKGERVILEAALEIVKIFIVSNQIIFSNSASRNYYENLGSETKSGPKESME